MVDLDGDFMDAYCDGVAAVPLEDDGAMKAAICMLYSVSRPHSAPY